MFVGYSAAFNGAIEGFLFLEEGFLGCGLGAKGFLARSQVQNVLSGSARLHLLSLLELRPLLEPSSDDPHDLRLASGLLPALTQHRRIHPFMQIDMGMGMLCASGT